jgi:putative DNA primase/helicase
MSEPDMLAEALAYYKAGLAVLPLHSLTLVGGWGCTCGQKPCPHKPGKHPRDGYGPAHPITDESGIRAAWERWPDANIGVIIPDGFFVAELDGTEAIQWWEERAQGVVTRTTLSGSGGQHRWYRGEAQSGTLQNWGEHREVAVRRGGNNQYLVMPPSMHESGQRYSWLHDVAAVEATPELLEAIRVAKPNGSRPVELAPVTATDKQVLARCRQARSKARFAALYDQGDLSEYNHNHSDADQALCGLFARWTSDVQQIDRLFRTSALYREEKWGERQDYRESTIAKALEWWAEQRAKMSGEFFDPDGGFVPQRLGEHLNDECRIARGKDGRLWRYREGVYRPEGLDYAARRTRELLGDRFRKRHWLEVRCWLEADEPVIGVEADPDWLNLPNGRLHWRTGTLMEHSQDYLDTIRIPVEWRPGARCPLFEDFLAQVLPADCIDFVLELLGYLLIPDPRFQKAVMFLGQGGTDKGTLLHVMRQLCGPENVSALPLHAFAEDRFATSKLFGKLANLCGDLDARNVERSDTFKQVTGQDAVTGQFKYGPLFEFIPFSRLLFSANEAPPSSDQSTAYFDRWLVVPMTNRFRGTEAEDTSLREKLTIKGELEGILQAAVEALRRLMNRGRFQVPGSVEKANEDFRLTLDTVRNFVSERVVQHAESWTPRKKLCDAYTEWCHQNGRGALSSQKFYERIRADYPFTDAIRDGTRGFKGAWLLLV